MEKISFCQKPQEF